MHCMRRPTGIDVVCYFFALQFSLRLALGFQNQISVDGLMARCSADIVDCSGQTFGSACVNGGESLCSSQCTVTVRFGC